MRHDRTEAALTRRRFMGSAAAGAALAAAPDALAAPFAPHASRRLVAAPGRQALAFGNTTQLVDTWSYDGTVPGPLQRYRVGDRLEFDVEWMLHCHMIEHQPAGMMTFLTVEGDRA